MNWGKSEALIGRRGAGGPAHAGLVSSSLWHRLAWVDPLVSLLFKIQLVLADFIWDKLHWVPQSVLFLPKEEGGQGLVHLASWGTAFCLQFIQRLLTGPKDTLWRPLSRCILQGFKGLGHDFNLFLMNIKNTFIKSRQRDVLMFVECGTC